MRPSHTTSCSPRSPPTHLPHLASSLVLSARLVFLILRTNQFSHLSFGKPPTASWIFPVLHSYLALISINTSVNLYVHCVVHLAQDCFPYKSYGRLEVGKAAKGVAPIPGSQTKCYAPPSGVASPSTLGRERREQTIPQIKDYIIDRQNKLNAPSYIARAWAHYNTIRGAPFPREMSQSEGNCTNQSPNQTPMHPRQCQCCARQRHMDTMHNIEGLGICGLISFI